MRRLEMCLSKYLFFSKGSTLGSKESKILFFEYFINSTLKESKLKTDHQVTKDHVNLVNSALWLVLQAVCAVNEQIFLYLRQNCQFL